MQFQRHTQILKICLQRSLLSSFTLLKVVVLYIYIYDGELGLS